MPDDRDRFLSLDKVAVVGASRDPSKYGNIVYKRLKAAGVKTFAVNPNAETVDGDPSYPSLDRLPEKVSGAVLVVPPARSEEAVRAAAAAGIGMIWMQPGAESDRAVRYCEENGLCAIHDACILVALGLKKR